MLSLLGSLHHGSNSLSLAARTDSAPFVFRPLFSAAPPLAVTPAHTVFSLAPQAETVRLGARQAPACHQPRGISRKMFTQGVVSQKTGISTYQQFG